GIDYRKEGIEMVTANLIVESNAHAIWVEPAVRNIDPTQQTEIDNFMLGANAILAVSLAVCKDGASVLDIPLYMHIANLAGNKNLVLPVPSFNVINGGSHAGNKLAMQLMILPVGAKSFKEAMKMGVELYHNLKMQLLVMKVDLLKTAIAKDIIGMDVSTSEFYGSDKTYDLNFKEKNNNGAAKISGEKVNDLYRSFSAGYPKID
ncbi:hypothetical protein MKX03_017776, partial [Papaver bracteatum]